MKPFGIDVSRWQSSVNFGAVVQDSRSPRFCGIRATISNYYVDPYLIANLNGCQAVGLAPIVYHVIRGDKTIGGLDNSAKAQMNKFVTALNGNHDVSFALDCELGYYNGTTTQIDKKLLTDVVQESCEILSAWFPQQHVMNYSRKSFVDYFMVKGAAWYQNYDWWLAQYLSSGEEHQGPPSLPVGVPYNRCIIHQTSDRGKIAGIDASVDLNRWQLSEDEMNAYFGFSDETEEPELSLEERLVIAVEKIEEKL